MNNHEIYVPTTLNHASEIDSRNKNTFCRDVIAKEMKSVGVAFDMLESGHISTLGYKIVSVHIIFDANMDFT